MGKLMEKIVREEEKFINSNKEYPKFLIINAGDAGDLSYEVALEMELEDEDAITYNLTNWRGMTLCIVMDNNFNSFVLK